MKKVFILPLIGIVLTLVSSTSPPGKLTGRWQPKMMGGVSAITVYRTDGTFDIFLNNKTFVSGRYKVNQDTLSISDPICGTGYYGTYQLTFITEDSIRQTLIQDTCQVRRNSIGRSPAMGRIKAMKP